MLTNLENFSIANCAKSLSCLSYNVLRAVLVSVTASAHT